MKCLVTGGAGFIGSHLVERLIADGRDVVVLDDCSTGCLANLAGVSPTIIHGSITDRLLVQSLVSEADEIYHLAAAVGVIPINSDPLRTIAANVAPTEDILAAASASKRRPRVFLASTSEVYGKSAAELFSEDGDCVLGPSSVPRWSYACSKLLDEFAALGHANRDGLKVVVGRFFNVSGPRQVALHGMVIPTFVERALSSRDLCVHGTGRQTRCFAHVSDVVECIVRLMAEPRACGRVVNIGSDQSITMMDLARQVVHRAGSYSRIDTISHESVYGAAFEDVARRVPDLRLLESLIGFRPQMTIGRIVDDAVTWRRNAS